MNQARGPGMLLLCAVLAATVSQASAGEMRPFTDTSGRTIRAEVVATTGQTVRIMREDGRTFDIEKAVLSEADQQYIAAWEWDRAFASGGVTLQVRRVRKKSDFEVTKSSRRKDEQWCFRVTVANGSRAHLDGLVAQWRVFYFDDTAAAKRDKLPLKRKAGQVSLDALDPGGETDFETAVVRLQTTSSRSGGSRSDSGKQTVEDSLEGFWVRVVKGEEVLVEQARPQRLAKEEAW